MRVKKYLALTLAAVLATTMLTACPWDQEEDKTDDASSVPVTSTDTGQDDDDHDSGDDDGQEEGLTENKITISATEGGEVQKGTLTTIENGYTYSFSVTADEKMKVTAKATVYSPTAGELTATWPEQENTATRARTLSVRADTELKLTPDNDTNPTKFTLTGIPANATSCDITVEFKDPGYTIAADGTYMVYNADGLKAFADEVNGGKTGLNCTLTANIDLGEENWTPIGNFSNLYTGTFDGAGHAISGLQVSGGDYVGLFGFVNGGTVENLNLEITSISGNYFVGGIAGCNNGIIQGCMVSGSVSGNDFVGGVVGYNASGSNVEGCCFAGGSVNGSGTNAYVGGVVGNNLGNITACCFAGGSVSDTGDSAYVGGVVGNNGSSGTITGCYWQAGTGGSPSQDVGSGGGGTTEVKDGNWSNVTLPEGFKLVDGKPVPSVIANRNSTPEVSGLTQRVLDTVRAFGL